MYNEKLIDYIDVLQSQNLFDEFEAELIKKVISSAVIGEDDCDVVKANVSIAIEQGVVGTELLECIEDEIKSIVNKRDLKSEESAVSEIEVDPIDEHIVNASPINNASEEIVKISNKEKPKAKKVAKNHHKKGELEVETNPNIISFRSVLLAVCLLFAFFGLFYVIKYLPNEVEGTSDIEKLINCKRYLSIGEISSFILMIMHLFILLFVFNDTKSIRTMSLTPSLFGIIYCSLILSLFNFKELEVRTYACIFMLIFTLFLSISSIFVSGRMLPKIISIIANVLCISGISTIYCTVYPLLDSIDIQFFALLSLPLTSIFISAYNFFDK